MLNQLREAIRLSAAWLGRAIRQPRGELDRWQRAARFTYDLCWHGARQLREDRAAEIAASLSFRSLFALLPVLVVATILVRAVMGIDEFIRLVRNVLSAAGLDQIHVLLGSPDGGEKTNSTSLHEWLAQMIGEAAHVNLAAVGWVGFLLIVYAAIGLLVTIEDSFNKIFRAPEGRSWTRRVPLYWFLLTVSPLALSLTAFARGRVDAWAAGMELSPWLLGAIDVAWSVSVTWLLLGLVFRLVPNTAVSAYAAAVGSFISVLLLEIGKRSLGAYLEKAFGMSQLYGSLGLIPLFMFWVYLMWLAVLFGLEVSATLQLLGGRRLDEMERDTNWRGVLDPTSLVTIMELAVNEFQDGRSIGAPQLAERMHVPENQLRVLLDALVLAGFLHRLPNSPDICCVAKPPEQISVAQLLELGYHLVPQGQRSPLVERLREAQRQLAAGRTLAQAAAG